MSVAPNTGIVEFGPFVPPSGGLDGIQGQVPGPTSAETGYVLTTSGWAPGGGGGGSGTVTSVSGTGSVNGITLSGTVTTSGSITLGGSLSNVSLSTQVTGTLPVLNGGTGATTISVARTNLEAQKTITSGTASPSGGVDGDIYLQYV